jgi:Uma2 family endonuclease
MVSAEQQLMAATSRLTLEQFLTLEETEPASEYACGEVVQKPMPNRHQAAVQFFFAAMLFNFLARTPIGRAFTEFRCIFGPPGLERTYVPDLTYVANECLTADLYLRAAPDLAVEILSPDQDAGRFLDKIQFYLRHGVRLAWVIDPVRETVTVLVPEHDARVLTRGDTLDGGEVLPGFSVAVDEIFAQTGV